ncbi:methionine--tRNA ligase [Hyphobacterium sp. CCMP332]|nr:methionine--tRNA ligase [Hyphobacterium sp. CCMP332]
MSNKNFKRHTITAALPYANGPIHIGHLAGVYIPSDIYARFLRLKKRDVAFICGSDEHGMAITMRARKEGLSPKMIIDRYHNIIKKSLDDLGISFDMYSRTSSPVHNETAAEFFKTLYEKGVFEETESEQYYDSEAKQFLADRYIKGICPICSYSEAYGDQCENCGSSLNPRDLKNPVSTLSGKKPELKKTRHWFLPMDKYENWLKKWILEEHKEWKSNVYGQCKSWLDGGLQARAMTRDLDWGVQVPLEGAEGKVLYVWFDAPIGYISATREWAEANNKNWEDYWKDEETRLIHFIGKDNIVFHCIIFPTILKAEGSYILPDNVPANEFLNLEGQKISTSRNWAVWLHEYLEDFPGKQDVLRYSLTANAPETKDNDFTWKEFQLRNNSELVAIYGNFINRTLVLTHKYFDGLVPNVGDLNTGDQEVISRLKNFPSEIEKSLEEFKFRDALSKLMDLARLGNKYLADNEPWKLIKTDEERVKTIIYLSLQIAASLKILSAPFLPFSSNQLGEMLNLKLQEWDSSKKFPLIESGSSINKASLLFEKIEDEAIEKQIQKLEQTKMDNQSEVNIEASKPEVSFEDFTKMDIRVAKILAAEKVAKTKKLLQIKVDTGIDQRTVVSGIAEYFEPEKIIGMDVLILVNLAPRKIKGIESQGMILMAENDKGELYFVAPKGELNPGSRIS